MMCRKHDLLVVHISDIVHIYWKKQLTTIYSNYHCLFIYYLQDKLGTCYCSIVLLHIIQISLIISV